MQWPSFGSRSPPISPIERSFGAQYLGDADVQLKAYRLNGWSNFSCTYDNVKYPSTSILQSASFGKSRLLYGFTCMMQKNEGPMRLLYTCMDPKRASPGFPSPTTKLNDFFFAYNCTVESLTHKLFVAFEYAMENWETVGTEWFGLLSRLSKE